MLIAAYSQEMPAFVQQRLDNLHNKAKKCLTIYRYGYSPDSPNSDLPNKLKSSFSDEEKMLIDSLGLKLHIGMIYDDAMRNRIVELMQNQYQEYELDSLVNRYISRNIKVFEWRAMEICKMDTLSIFKSAMDSLYSFLTAQNTLDVSKKINRIYDYDIFKLLRLDTTKIFKQTYENIVSKEKIQEREYYLTKTNYNYSYLARLCGYIGDKRFIPSLIQALDKPDNFNNEKVMEALVRLRVAPYYKEYIKFRTRTMEEIKSEKQLGFYISDFVDVLGTQEAFLELSKYLLSDKPYLFIDSSYEDHSEEISFGVSVEAFSLICDNLENEDMLKLIGGRYSEPNATNINLLYKWMQKNYGKYKIKRLW
jgi:hypothetical protein